MIYFHRRYKSCGLGLVIATRFESSPLWASNLALASCDPTCRQVWCVVTIECNVTIMSIVFVTAYQGWRVDSWLAGWGFRVTLGITEGNLKLYKQKMLLVLRSLQCVGGWKAEAGEPARKQHHLDCQWFNEAGQLEHHPQPQDSAVSWPQGDDMYEYLLYW